MDSKYECSISAADDTFTSGPILPSQEVMVQMAGGIAEWLVHKTSGIKMTAADIMTAGEITREQYASANGATVETLYMPAAVNCVLRGCRELLTSPLKRYEELEYEVHNFFIGESEKAMLDSIRHLFTSGDMYIDELRSDLTKFLVMISLAGYSYDNELHSEFLKCLQAGAWAKLTTSETGSACRPLVGDYHRILKHASVDDSSRLGVMIAAEDLTEEERAKINESSMISITEHRERYVRDRVYFYAKMSVFEYNLLHMAYRIKSLFKPARDAGWTTKTFMEEAFQYYTKGFAKYEYTPGFNAKVCDCPKHCYAASFYDNYELTITPITAAQYDTKHRRFYVPEVEMHDGPAEFPFEEVSTDTPMDLDAAVPPSSADRKRKASPDTDDTPAAKKKESSSTDSE